MEFDANQFGTELSECLEQQYPNFDFLQFMQTMELGREQIREWILNGELTK